MIPNVYSPKIYLGGLKLFLLLPVIRRLNLALCKCSESIKRTLIVSAVLFPLFYCNDVKSSMAFFPCSIKSKGAVVC